MEAVAALHASHFLPLPFLSSILPSGYYQAAINHTYSFCNPWTNCVPGQRITNDGTTSTNQVCGACPAGYYSYTNNAATCTQCSAGYYQSQQGQSACLECGLNYYSNPGASNCSLIPAGYYGNSGSITARGGVAPCPAGYACPGGAQPPQSCILGRTYQPNTGQSTCLSVTQCSSGYELITAATISTDNVCSTCIFGSQFGLNNQCYNYTVCPPGTYPTVAPTVTSDRVCSPCPNNTYKANSNNNNCTAYSWCFSGTYISTPGSPTSNVVCSSCTAGVNFANSTNQTSCHPVSICNAGFAEGEPPTVST